MFVAVSYALNLQNICYIRKIMLILSEYCILSDNIHDYHVVSQGKTTIPSVDDAEEFQMTDVRRNYGTFFLIISKKFCLR